MINYVLKSTNYSSFLIADVLDSNKPALRLYEKSGFIQTKIIKEKASILKRNKYRITLKYNK